MSELKNKPQQKQGLHKFIALGGKPKDYDGCQGINSETIPKINKSYKSSKK